MASELARFLYLEWQQPEKRYPFLIGLGLSLFIIVFSGVSVVGALGVIAASSLISFALSPVIKYGMTLAARIDEMMNEVTLASKEAKETVKEAKETVANVKEKVVPELQGLVKETVDNLNKKVVPELQILVKDTVENVQDMIEDKADNIIEIAQEAAADSTLLLKNTAEDLQAVLRDVDSNTLPTVNKTISELGKTVAPVTGTVDLGKKLWKSTIGKLTADDAQEAPQPAPTVAVEITKEDKTKQRAQEREQLANQRALEREARKAQRLNAREKRRNKTTLEPVLNTPSNEMPAQVLSTPAQEVSAPLHVAPVPAPVKATQKNKQRAVLVSKKQTEVVSAQEQLPLTVEANSAPILPESNKAVVRSKQRPVLVEKAAKTFTPARDSQVKEKPAHTTNAKQGSQTPKLVLH